MLITECSREFFQNKKEFIPIEKKAYYINQLISIGFDYIDAGSLASPLVVPQFRDFIYVFDSLKDSETTKNSILVFEKSSFNKVINHNKIHRICLPFSICENFQIKNTNKNLEQSFNLIRDLISKNTNKEILIYISNVFKNNENNTFNIDKLLFWTEKLIKIGIKNINLCDTENLISQGKILKINSDLINKFPEINFGLHLHSEYENNYKKIDFAFKNNFNNLDVSILGLGSCPSLDNKIGNIPTEKLINYLEINKIQHSLNILAFETAYNTLLKIK